MCGDRLLCSPRHRIAGGGDHLGYPEPFPWGPEKRGGGKQKEASRDGTGLTVFA